MVTRFNPYSPGVGDPPPVLAGRDKQLARFHSHLARLEGGVTAQETAYTGVRGYGKTSLLTAFLHEARSRSWLTELVKAQRGVSLLDSVTAQLTDRSRVPSKLRPKIHDMRDEIAALRLAITGRAGPVGGGVEATVAPLQPSLSVSDATVRLVDRIGRAVKDAGVGAALLIDEVQEADPKDLSTLFRAIETAKAEPHPLLVVLAGLPEGEKMVRTATTGRVRVLFETLGPLSPEATIRALREPAAGVVEYTDEALSALVDHTQGNPYLIQLYGSVCWEESFDSEMITLEHVEQSRPVVMQQLYRGVYRDEWEDLPEWGRHYMAALSQLHGDDGWVSTSDIAAFLGRPATDLTRTRATLIEAQHIEPTRGQVRATDRLFLEFVAELVQTGEFVPSLAASREPPTGPTLR